MEINIVPKVASQFTKEKILKIENIPGGHINKTFFINSKKETFILQKINTDIFRNPKGLMQNLEKITNHLFASDYPFQPVIGRRTHSGEFLYNYESETWRAIEYIANCRSIEKAENPETIETAAIAFGKLTKALLSMDPSSLIETIPDFHNPEKRFNDLILAIENSGESRKEEATDLIDQALALRTIVEIYKNTIINLQVRVTHNDAKVGNILFNDSLSEVIAIIDMDTMMPGYLMNDFGDMARSMCNPANEDSSHLKSVYFDVRRFEFLSKGYLRILRKEITEDEINSFLTGIKSVIYTQFIRFLADFLAGDIYYHTTYPDQNLNRARVQMKLLHDFQGKEDGLAEVINGF